MTKTLDEIPQQHESLAWVAREAAYGYVADEMAEGGECKRRTLPVC
jgi:hypothetical protein